MSLLLILFSPFYGNLACITYGVITISRRVFLTQFRIQNFICHSAYFIPQHHSVSYTLASFRILTRPVRDGDDGVGKSVDRTKSTLPMEKFRCGSLGALVNRQTQTNSENNERVMAFDNVRIFCVFLVARKGKINNNFSSFKILAMLQFREYLTEKPQR